MRAEVLTLFQVLAVPENALFRNCLVLMRPRATNLDLPTSHEVKVHLHNECVKWLKDLKKDVNVSCTTSDSSLDISRVLCRQHQERFQLLLMDGQQTIPWARFLE